MHLQAKTVDELYEQLAAEKQRAAEARGLVADAQDELGAREQQVKELEHTLTEVQRVATAIEEDVRPQTAQMICSNLHKAKLSSGSVGVSQGNRPVPFRSALHVFRVQVCAVCNAPSHIVLLQPGVGDLLGAMGTGADRGCLRCHRGL